MNEMRKLMESIDEAYFGKQDWPSQEGEMSMDEIDAIAKKRGLTNDDVWKATILAHDAGKYWDMELEVRDDNGDVYGRFPSIQDVPTFVKHPKTGKELEADVDHIYIIYKTNPEQVEAMFDWYESEAKAEHQRKQDEKEHEQFYQWMGKNPFEGVNESYHSRLAAAIDDLVTNNKNLSPVELVGRARLELGDEAAKYLSNKLESDGDFQDTMDESWPQEETHADMVEYWKQSLSSSIVRKGVFTQMYDAAGQDIDELNAAIADQAESIADSYHGSGEGIGTSDVNHFIYNIAQQLGIDDIFGWNKPRESVFKENSEGQLTPELFDEDGFHIAVRKAKFMPSDILDGEIVLHDLENISPDSGEPKLVTFRDQDAARKAAKKFGGMLTRTQMGTYRIVPIMKSDDEMERDKTSRYAKYNTAIRGKEGLGENAPIDHTQFQDGMPDEGDLVRIEGGEYDGQRGTVLNIQGDFDEEGYGVLTHTIKLQSGKTVDVDIVETHFNDIYLTKVGEYEYDDEAEDEFAYSNPFEARMLELAGVPIKEGKFGVYRKSKQQLDSPDGHSSSESAKVKRGGEHVTFSSKSAAEKWIKDNSKDEELFVRKVSKPVKEAKGRVVEVPPEFRGTDPSNEAGATSRDVERFLADLGPDDDVSHDVVDPETGELLDWPTKGLTRDEPEDEADAEYWRRQGGTKRQKAKRDLKLRGDDEPLSPSLYAGRSQEEAYELLDELRNSDFYNVVWKNASEEVGSPEDLGAEGGDWGDLNYDVDVELPTAIKRKDGKRFNEDDHDNFREIVKATKRASTMGNFGIQYVGTTNKGTVARFVPSFM